MPRISGRALIATIIGLALTVGGCLTVQLGMAHRYQSAQSAITLRDGQPPADVDQYTFYSASGDSETFVEDNLENVLSGIRAALLGHAEATGSFSVFELTAYVEEPQLVAVAGEMPDLRGFRSRQDVTPWIPHAYMIAPFSGALITFAGLFWMAARWHMSAPVRHREIDETPP